MKTHLHWIWISLAAFGPAAPARAAGPPAQEARLGAAGSPPRVEVPKVTGDAPPPPPAPYSLPWQLRPAVAATVVRSDTSVAFLEAPMGQGGSTVVSGLIASYRVTPSFAPLLRLAIVESSPPTGAGATTLVNPVVGGIYASKPHDDLRLGLFLGIAVPIGMGGGDTPDAAEAATTKSGIPARAAMDNAMFAVNYLTVVPGAGLAYVRAGFTAQLEATLLQLVRVRGEEVERDEARTNLTAGLHFGYFLAPWVSLGGELRYQRWLSTPAGVAMDPTGASRDNLGFAVGPRFHVQLGDQRSLRPGLAYAQALDDPMGKVTHRILQLDIPVIF